MRILNRITGITPTLLDLAGVIVLAVVLSWQVIWFYGLITAVVQYVNQSMDGKRIQGIFLAMIIIPLVILSILLGNPDLVAVDISSGTTIATAAITLLFIPVIFLTDKVQSLTDATEEPVSFVRLCVTRLIAVGTGFLVAAIQGNNSFVDVLPVWTAIVGVLIYYVYCRLFRIPYS
jgi:hypothetical protein